MLPFNKPFIVGKELYNVARSVIEYKQLSGGGEFTKQCQQWFEKNLHTKKALLTHSCTAALEMAAILCDIQPGDEVILPSFTFVSTANAFVLRGGIPVFIDIRPDTLNIDENKIEEAISHRTKAIVPVHYAGVPCEMKTIQDIADKYNLFVIEDAAQALLSKYHGEHLGTIGDLGTLSFHETKNIISGEGGALLINNEDFIERAEIIWEKGTNRKQFFRGEVEKYTWMDIGSSYLPSEIVAAFLAAQLEQAEKIIETRSRIFELYYKLLSSLSQQEKIRLPVIDADCSCNGHIFYIITNTQQERSELLSFLSDKEINAIFHYIPLHSSPAGKKYGKTDSSMQHTGDLSRRIVRLPLFFEMSDEQVIFVTDQIKKFYAKR